MRTNKRTCWWGVVSFSLLFAGLLPGSAYSAQIMSAATAQKAAKAAGLSWTARDNWLSRLPKEEVKRMMGVQDPPSAQAAFIAPFSFSAQDATSLDWRNKDGVNWVTPILNQGNCGSCVSFATVATLGTQVNVTSGIPGLNQEFSTQALFACGGGGCQFGWQPNLAAQYLQRTGVPDEACAPYTMGSTGQDVKCNSICSDAKQRSYKIASYRRPTDGTTDIDRVKEALKRGPLVTTMMVYEDFLTYSKGVYTHVTGDALGGHAVSIIGYDDTTRSWIIRNSWGVEWGDNGFANISWDDTSGISDQTWAFDLPAAQGYVTVKNPRDRMIVSGNASATAESTFPQTTKLDISVLNRVGKVVLSSSCSRSDCQMDIPSQTLADGEYEIMATAHWGQSASSNSEHERFFVLNSKPVYSLSFSGVSGTDLSQPISGRVEFDVLADSKPVPFSSLVFHVKDASGQEVIKKSTSMVLSKMKLGWRTITVPNGKYEIWFSAKISAGATEYPAESQHVAVEVRN